MKEKNDDYSQDQPQDGLYLFARALTMLLYENEGIVVYNEETEENKDAEPTKYIVYTSKGYVHVMETVEDLEEGELVHLHSLDDINLN